MPRSRAAGSAKRQVRTGRAVPLGFAAVAAVLVAGAYFGIPALLPAQYASVTERAGREESLQPEREPDKRADEAAALDPNRPRYLETPEPLKAIYMSQCVAGTPSFREDLVALIDETELNAVVIDVKDYTGKLGFSTDHPALAASVSDECGAVDMRSFLDYVKEKNIYTIARITVFQDPYYTVAHPELAVKKASDTEALWSDNKGLHFIDVSARPFWEYIVTLSKETHALGFDELNFDYIRFPSDGPMQDIHFPWSKDMEKQVALEHFFKYLHDELKDPDTYPPGVPTPVLSADLFGMTTTNTDDLNIGQVLERALPYFDYIAPMVYPSHYPAGFNGYANPNHVPYDVIRYSMDRAVARTIAERTVVETFDGKPIMKEVTVPATEKTATTTKEVFSGFYTKPAYDKLKLRPWLQDFDYGGDYDVEEVRAQIQATYDAGLTSWMLWAPSNRYTRGALESE